MSKKRDRKPLSMQQNRALSFYHLNGAQL